MSRIVIHENIQRMTEFFYRIGLWHRQNEETVGDRRLKWFYLIYFSTYTLSLLAGAVTCDHNDDAIFLLGVALMSVVLMMKLWYIIWKKEEILELLKRICDYRIDEPETLSAINNKLNIFMIFVKFFLILYVFCTTVITLVAPFAGTERKLFLQIGFPLDYRNDEFAFWMASLFLFTQESLAFAATLFSVIIWYLMITCSWRYQVLGQQMKKMGEIQTVIDESSGETLISYIERDNQYSSDLIQAITSNNALKELTSDLETFSSKMFGAQLTTSGIFICISIYSIAYIQGENLFELSIYLSGTLYVLSEIFMIMYFGNEIKLASDRLSYCLFESDWTDRSQSIKKNILIFGEFLMQPQVMVVLKLYPLTLETFRRVLNSAYSMFNILKNLR